MLRCAYGEVEGLLVVGGGEPEQPEGLALLPLPEPAQQVGACIRGALEGVWSGVE